MEIFGNIGRKVQNDVHQQFPPFLWYVYQLRELRFYLQIFWTMESQEFVIWEGLIKEI